MLDAELEYQRARKAYDAAVKRLQIAKANRPPIAREPIPRKQQTRAEATAEKERCWAMYLAGERDPKVLAKHFGHTPGWAHQLIRRFLRDRQLGPETPYEHRSRMEHEQYLRWNQERLRKLIEPD